MSGKKISMGISQSWVQKPGECLPCMVCKDLIYGNRYNLEVTVFMTKKETEANLCESCYTKMLDNESR